jgi:hypothetical protein
MTLTMTELPTMLMTMVQAYRDHPSRIAVPDRIGVVPSALSEII